MRRPLLFVVFLLCALTGLPAMPSAQRTPTLSAELREPARLGERVRIIVQPPFGKDTSALRGRLRGLIRRELQGAVALEVSRAELDLLMRDSAFGHISADAPVAADMATANKVTRASSVWQGTSSLLGSTPGYTGAGIGVAVVDSGIAPHTAVADRVIARVNFVTWESTSSSDPYGHGTHVAGIVAGNTTAAKDVTAAFAGGSAPAVRLIDVRVLGSRGMGYTSDVIAGIDWSVKHRAKYGIRVINLSLGHPVSEPSTTDPLCRAVQRAVEAGIVVVASAGNHGMTSTGAPVLGGITSPGNSPYAVTVGAIDTGGTADTSDDKVAPYSSRGPSAFDLAVKPDVVAPGTRLTSLEAPGSYLLAQYPGWHVAGKGKNAYFRLSGTSMATAAVSGGVALLLDAEEDLTPAQVKIALQMGAKFVPDGGLIGAGAGGVDFSTSLRLAQSGLVPSLLGTLTDLLGTSGGATFRDTGTLIDRLYGRTGLRLLGLLDAGLFWDQADTAEWGVLNLLGLLNPLATVPAHQLIWGEVAGWTESDHLVWGDSVQTPTGQHLVWGDSEYTGGNHLVWGDAAADGAR